MKLQFKLWLPATNPEGDKMRVLFVLMFLLSTGCASSFQNNVGEFKSGIGEWKPNYGKRVPSSYDYSYSNEEEVEEFYDYDPGCVD